jgi:serine/threonine-protein kinase ULK/ATG1
MHRDFKLANILKHNGNIKIADFGFSKLLGSSNYASTMLGSPLNMAPEGNIIIFFFYFKKKIFY